MARETSRSRIGGAAAGRISAWRRFANGLACASLAGLAGAASIAPLNATTLANAGGQASARIEPARQISPQFIAAVSPASRTGGQVTPTRFVATETPDTDCPKARSLLSQRMKLQGFTKLVHGKAPVRVLAIGSSSTEGVGASMPARSYPARFEAELKGRLKLRDVRVVNAGIGGETAEASVSRLEAQLAKTKYDMVIWQVGTNDAVRGDDEGRFRALLERGVRAARAARADLVFLDQQFYPSIRDPLKYERFVQLIHSVAKENGAPVLSRYQLMKTWGERAPRELPTMLASDGFHMSDRGYHCLASAMGGAMTELAGESVVPSVVSASGGQTPTPVSFIRR
jgi:lysophospholipase L1-like esterase